MPTLERHKTKYPGVWYYDGTGMDGKPEKVYYIGYRRNGKWIEEKAGWEKKNDMSAYGASLIRGARIKGEEPSNKEKREVDRAAKAAAAAAQAEAEGRWTFNRLWDAWKEANQHKSGLVNDDNRYRTHLKGPLGDREPRELVPLDVERIRARMLKTSAPPPGRKRKKPVDSKKPYAIGTVKSVLSLLSRIANFGVKRQLCEGLRFKVEGPKGAKQRTEDMTADQMARYIKTCREWPDAQAGSFQLLALYTGMRRSEVRNLKRADVDLDRGFIHLRDVKGGEDQKIPISDQAAELLWTIPETVGNPYLFPGERGEGPRGLRQVSDSSRAIRDAAGLPKDFRPNHGLRHTFASHLASSGEVDIYTLQKLMTHKSPVMTQRYAHLTDAALKRGANVMGKIMEQATTDATKEGTNE